MLNALFLVHGSDLKSSRPNHQSGSGYHFQNYRQDIKKIFITTDRKGTLHAALERDVILFIISR